eukprot:COSAG02_NODE_6888_length_3306_cov_3.325538_1_plen_43_part_10
MALGEQLLDGPIDPGRRTIHAKRRPRAHARCMRILEFETCSIS